MLRSSCVFLCTILVLSHLNPAFARKTSSFGRHSSYPKSNSGLSGSHGNSHSYPKSGGLSGSSSGGQSHSYPSSGGSSGHGYPSNTHHSGGNAYPPSGGLSGNSRPAQTTQIHNHYHYSPPNNIQYTPRHGGPPVSYPVYHGTPPPYVAQYKNSGSKYGTLLAGLALMNLGALAGAAYGLHQSHSSYKAQPGEICKFGIRKENGDYEETRIDCNLISSFILQEEANKTRPSNTTVVTTTVTNTTVVNANNDVPAPIAPAQEANQTIPSVTNYAMYPNGTLVPITPETSSPETPAANEASNASPEANALNNTSTVTVVTTTTTVNATDVKGPPVDVTPGMKCYVMRNSPTTNMRKSVPCGLLQTYADKSLKKNSANKLVSSAPIFVALLFTFVLQY